MTYNSEISWLKNRKTSIFAILLCCYFPFELFGLSFRMLSCALFVADKNVSCFSILRKRWLSFPAGLLYVNKTIFSFLLVVYYVYIKCRCGFAGWEGKGRISAGFWRVVQISRRRTPQQSLPWRPICIVSSHIFPFILHCLIKCDLTKGREAFFF